MKYKTLRRCVTASSATVQFTHRGSVTTIGTDRGTRVASIFISYSKRVKVTVNSFGEPSVSNQPNQQLSNASTCAQKAHRLAVTKRLIIRSPTYELLCDFKAATIISATSKGSMNLEESTNLAESTLVL